MKKIYKTFALSAAAVLAGAQGAIAAKTISILPPQNDSEWRFYAPIIKLDDKTTVTMTVAKDRCGWYNYTFEDDKVPNKIIFFPKNDKDMSFGLGLTGYTDYSNGQSPNPIELSALFKNTGTDSLFFIPDENSWVSEFDGGWYASAPDAEGTCEYASPVKTYTASVEDFQKLQECGTSCWTDNEKFSAILDADKNTSSCDDRVFTLNTDNTWNLKSAMAGSCSSLKTNFSKEMGQKLLVSGANLVWAFIDGTAFYQSNASTGADTVNFESLVDGKNYNLELFYCQQSEEGSVQLSHNLDVFGDVIERTAINIQRTKDIHDKAIDIYDMCFSYSATNSCSIVNGEEIQNKEYCGDDLAKLGATAVRYYMVAGTNISSEQRELLKNGAVNLGGIDLTNPYQPAINKKTISLNPGRWTLFVEINDGQNSYRKKIASLRVAGEIAIMPESSVATWFDEDDTVINNIPYQFVGEGIVGTLIPLYVSAIVQYSPTLMQPSDAVGMQYTLNVSEGVQIFKKSGDKMTEINPTTTQTVNAIGVDTIYAYMSPEAARYDVNVASISVAGTANVANINFVKSADLLDIKPIAQASTANISVTGPRQFTMTFNGQNAMNYALFDTKGKMVKQGVANNGSSIQVPGRGVYIVRAAGMSKVLKFK